jgi:branched-chain amino acid transport system permease protein
MPVMSKSLRNDKAGTHSSTVGRWFVVCFTVTAAALPAALGGDYLAGLLVQAMLFGIVALLTDIIWGYAGILSFASAAMFGTGAYFLGGVFVHLSSSPANVFLAAAGAAVIVFLASAGIGWLAFYSRTKVSEFYIAVVTLGVSVLLGQAILYGGALTGGSNGLSGFPTLGVPNKVWYVGVVVMLMVMIAIAMTIVRSDFGLVLKAIRDNEMRCRYLGIDTPLMRTMVFSLTNATIAIVGVVYATFTTVVAPSLVGIAAATNVIIWVILSDVEL